ncbi:hypothetical protein P7H70_08840 [Vagococcus carniphilus]|uniref:Uncharacterized protein n=1 Tax=Vagococcus carniphilus TaxID=218144 RepID=A0AAW8U4Z2_9ENTE|nr:hypothetical protein [Vagococcus carniphilus]MDT2834164.1 hypothetical protein [Vagococcus carniphilus]
MKIQFKKMNNLDKYFAFLFLAIVAIQTILFVSSPNSMKISLFFLWYFCTYMSLIAILNFLDIESMDITQVKKNFSLYSLLIIEYTFLSLLFSFPEKVLPNTMKENPDIQFLLLFITIICVIVTQIIIWNLNLNSAEKKEESLQLFPKVAKFIKINNSDESDNLYYRVAIGLENELNPNPIIKIETAKKLKNNEYEIIENAIPQYQESTDGTSDLKRISNATDIIKEKYAEFEKKGVINDIENIIIP